VERLADSPTVLESTMSRLEMWAKDVRTGL
jgi:hypothetical protein